MCPGFSYDRVSFLRKVIEMKKKSQFQLKISVYVNDQCHIQGNCNFLFKKGRCGEGKQVLFVSLLSLCLLSTHCFRNFNILVKTTSPSQT